MRNIILILQREFLTRVQKKSFLILTILTPLIFAGSIFLYTKLMTAKPTEIVNVKIVDNTESIGKQISDNEAFQFEILESISLDELKTKYSDSENAIILYIDGEKGGYPSSCSFYSNKTVSFDLQHYVRRTVNSTVENRKLQAYNIENLNEILASVRTNVEMRTLKWAKEKDKEETETSTPVTTMLSYLMAFTIFMFINMFGAMVVRGVVEEKSNRIVEVIISSVKPFQLMMGKILGIAMVGVTQFILWIIFTYAYFTVAQTFVSGSDNMLSDISSAFAGINISGLLAAFLFFFVGGYLLYASMFAAIGSAVDSESDVQQMSTPITIPLIISIMLMVHTLQYPDSEISFWASIVPFSSPIIMPARIPFGVPLWEILLSLTVLFGSFVFMCYVSSRIYRVGILMHGKKPSFKDLIKWFNYK